LNEAVLGVWVLCSALTLYGALIPRTAQFSFLTVQGSVDG
jgi:hypothetical protein